MSGVVSGILGGLLAAGLTALIARNVRRSALPGTLRFGVSMWILGLLCAVLAVLPAISTYLGHDREVWAKLLLTVGCLAGAIYAFGEAAFVRGTYDEEGIYFQSPWTGKKSQRWIDLRSIELNEWAFWYTLQFKDGEKIRLSMYLSGHVGALDAAARRSTA